MARTMVSRALLVLCCLSPLVLFCSGYEITEPPLLEGPLQVPDRLLMGPGPSTPHPRILAAQGLPVLGHMHPPFLKVMDEIKTGLKYAFQTKNSMTLAVSGTGHAGMEATVANIVEPGDDVIVGCNGIWGERMTDLVERYGAKVHRMDTPPGTTFKAEQVVAALDAVPTAKILFLVHGESSTGTFQTTEGISEACKARGVLLFMDAVCTLGGVPLYMDAMGIDVIYSGSQKVLGVPPGTAPVSFSPAARAKMEARSTKVQSYYFDMDLVGTYWGVDGVKAAYHHTGMISNYYALREGLAILGEEGLVQTWDRHRSNAEILWRGLEDLGLKLFVKDPAERLVTVTTIEVPDGVDWLAVNTYIMNKYSLEIAGGLGPTVGKVWRVGIMGYNAQEEKVKLVLTALKDALQHVGWLKTEL